MPVSLPLVRPIVLGEISPIPVSTLHKFDVPVVSDDQSSCFDRPLSLSLHLFPNRELLGRIFPLFRPRYCYCGHSHSLCERCVSTTLCVRLSKANDVLPRSFVGRLRDGAFTSKVAFQVGWLSYLCVMWLATGAQTAATLGAFTQISATLGGIVGCTDVCACFPLLSGY